MILIHDGYMIDPKSGREGNYDILIDGDKIVKIAEKIEPRGKVTRINAEGLLVAPGLVDVHVHFRDPGFTAKEDINTGAAAAAKGGVTTVVLMANTKPAVDSEETLHYILDKGAKTGIHVTTCANVTMGMQGKQLTDMKKLAVAGAVGFTDDGVPLLDAELVRRAMEISAELDKRDNAVINVSNDGPPISTASQEEIFIPFFTTKPEGSGIGLSLSRQIMRMHGGTLRLTRSDSEATVFTLIFK